MSVLEQSRTPVPDRLLAASDEPAGDWRALDWDATDAGMPWQPWDQVSLYDTPLWERLTPEQRLELSRHEAASVLAVAIWSENLLMRMLLRVAADQDPCDARARYALVEVADECRHSLMFARLIAALDVPRYRPQPAARRLTSLFSRLAVPAEVFAVALVLEEVLDAFQKTAIADPVVAPLARDVARIHVVEESRHIAFARSELGERWGQLAAPVRAAATMTVAGAAAIVTGALVDPQVYAAVGLDPRATARVARRSAHRRALLTASARRLVDDFTELGVITPRTRPIWRRAGLTA